MAVERRGVDVKAQAASDQVQEAKRALVKAIATGREGRTQSELNSPAAEVGGGAKRWE